MSKRLFLHVGLPKSGTTYLQAVLAENKKRLRKRARLLYPGASWEAQVLAARDVLAAHPHGVLDSKVKGAWDRLVREVNEWDGDAVVSMEWLGSAEPAQAQRIVDTVAPTQVHVVVTVRDLARTIPAAWQEFVQNWEMWSWQEFLAAVTSDNPRATPAGNMFWMQQDIGRLLAIWRDALPADQIHVVTLPHPGTPAGELWSRMAGVMGIDGSQFDASGKGSNESLGLESAQMMLRLNHVSRLQNLDWPLYNEMFKHALAKRGLSKRKHQEPVLVLPPELEEWTHARTAEQISAVKASGADVVGDLAELEPVFGKPGTQPEDVSSEALLEVALDGMVALSRDRGKELAKLRNRNAELRERIGQLEKYEKRHQRSVAMVTRRALISQSEKRPWMMKAREAYSRARKGG